MPERDGGAGQALLVFLLIATLAAGAFIYRARTPDLALEVVSQPSCLARDESDELEFFVRFDEPDATVQIVAAGQVPVRTLAEGVALTDGERVSYEWDGLDDEGEPVDRGAYRLRVTLPSEDRDMVYPTKIYIAREKGPLKGTCPDLEAPA